jgi:hypothetical protein
MCSGCLVHGRAVFAGVYPARAAGDHNIWGAARCLPATSRSSVVRSPMDRRCGYPPDGQKQDVYIILGQTGMLCKGWAAWRGPVPRVQHMIPRVYDGERAAAPS